MLLCGPQPATAKENLDAASIWVAAAELADTARSERDPVLLAAAARQMLLAEGLDSSLVQVSRNASALLEEARTIAGSDTLALALIDRYAGLQTRGGPNGPALQTIIVQPGKTVTVDRAFRARRSAIVYAETPVAQTLQLSVRNGKDGQNLCERGFVDGRALCRWTLGDAQQTRVSIANPSNTIAEVRIITN